MIRISKEKLDMLLKEGFLRETEKGNLIFTQKGLQALLEAVGVKIVVDNYEVYYTSFGALGLKPSAKSKTGINPFKD